MPGKKNQSNGNEITSDLTEFDVNDVKISGDFEKDKALYYDLYAPAWGGYARARLGQTLSDAKYEELDFNQKERMTVFDYDQYLWLQQHPDFDGPKTLINKYVIPRFKILVYYNKSDDPIQKEWVKLRLWIETAGFVKMTLKTRLITNSEMYITLYQGLCSKISEKFLADYEKKGYKYKPSTILGRFVMHEYYIIYAEQILGLTVNDADLLRKVDKAERDLAAMGIKDPTAEEVATQIGGNFTAEKVEKVWQMRDFTKKVSLDECNEVPDGLSPEQSVIDNEIRSALIEAFKGLPDDYKEIVALHLGGDFAYMYFGKVVNPMKISDIVEMFQRRGDSNVSRNKITTKLNKAANILKQNKILASYFSDEKYKRATRSNITKGKSFSDFYAGLDETEEIIEGIISDKSDDDDDNKKNKGSDKPILPK